MPPGHVAVCTVLGSVGIVALTFGAAWAVSRIGRRARKEDR